MDYNMESQGCVSLSSTDYEIHATHDNTKNVFNFFDMAKFLNMPCAGQSINIYQDNQSCSGTLTSGGFQICQTHCGAGALYLRKVVRGVLKLEYIPTALQPTTQVLNPH